MITTAKFSCIGGRPVNEDSCDVLESKNENVLAVVADGLGGHGGGDIASSTAVYMLSDMFAENPETTPERLEDWVQKINERVYELQTPQVKMKTTLAVLALNGKTAFTAHVGDSRVYHFVSKKFASVTFDHSVSQMAVLSGEITQEQIRHHTDRNKLLRAVGNSDDIRVEISKMTDVSYSNHAFLLCTDGFWENVNEDEMTETLQTSINPEQWISQMITIIRSRVSESHDNYTAVAVWIDN